jgi:hypothetical protein
MGNNLCESYEEHCAETETMTLKTPGRTKTRKTKRFRHSGKLTLLFGLNENTISE